MRNDDADQIRLRVDYSPDWIRKFDAAEYGGNRSMIEEPVEENQLALVQAMTLEQEAAQLRAEVTALRILWEHLKLAARVRRRLAAVQVVLAVLTVLLVGLGVNIVSAEGSHWCGWVLLSVAAVLEAIVFTIEF